MLRRRTEAHKSSKLRSSASKNSMTWQLQLPKARRREKKE